MTKQDKTIIRPHKTLLLGKEDKYLAKLDLIEIQKESWKKFINTSIREIINEFFPIQDYTGKKFTLSFEDLYLGNQGML